MLDESGDPALCRMTLESRPETGLTQSVSLDQWRRESIARTTWLNAVTKFENELEVIPDITYLISSVQCPP